MGAHRKDTSNTGNNKAAASGDRSQNDERRDTAQGRGNAQDANRDDLAGRPRDDGRHDTDLDDDRTDQRMAAQLHANRQAADALPQGGGDVQGGEQIDHGSHARAGMGKARQTDGT